MGFVMTYDVPRTMGMANPIHVAKLTGVLFPNRVYSIPFNTRFGPVPTGNKHRLNKGAAT